MLRPKNFLLGLLSVGLIAPTFLLADMLYGGSSSTSTSTIGPLPPPGSSPQLPQSSQKPQTGKQLPSLQKTEAPKPQPILPKQPNVEYEEPVYTFPGLVARIGRKWVGSDYLYNMAYNIGVKIEVKFVEGEAPKIDTDALHDDVAEIFVQGNLNPRSEAFGNNPPLPFFHILILVSNVDTQVAAFVGGRLFEPVILERFNFQPVGTWQAITWEDEDLIVTSRLQFEEQLKVSVKEIAKEFVDRVKLYNDAKVQAQSPIQLIPHPLSQPPPEPEKNREHPHTPTNNRTQGARSGGGLSLQRAL